MSKETHGISDSNSGMLVTSHHVLFLNAKSKKEALSALISCIRESDAIGDAEEFERGIFHREEMMSTGIGYGIAVPHVRLGSVKSLVLCVGICKTPLSDYESIDDRPIKLVFMIAAAVNQHEEYLALLSRISSMVKKPSVVESILQSNNTQQVCDIMSSYLE